MISGQLFFTILGISFFAVFAAILAPGSLRPAGRSWHLLVCNGPECPPGWASAVSSRVIPKVAKPQHENSDALKS